MRPRGSVNRWYAALAFVALTALALVSVAGPASASTPAPTTVSGWSTTASSAASGYVFRLPVVVKTGSGFVARSVSVQRTVYGTSKWSTVASGTTSASGRWSAPITVPGVGKWAFRLSVPATSTAAAYTSASRAITGVKGAFTTVSGWSTSALSAPIGYVFHDRVTIKSGTRYVGRSVLVQRAPYGTSKWSTIASGSSSASGVYTAALTVPSAGKWAFRLFVLASTAAAHYTSAARTITGIRGISTTVTGWSTSAAMLALGQSVPVAVTVKTGSGYSARSVLLQRAPAGSSTWNTVWAKSTSSSGRLNSTLMGSTTVGKWMYRLIVAPTTRDAMWTSNTRAVTVVAAPSITTPAGSVPAAVAGAPFKMQFAGSGGTGAYAWSATGLPAGLMIDPTLGLVSGTPTSTGLSAVTVTLTDTVTHATAKVAETFAVPTAVPAQCVGQACSVVDTGVNTLQLTAAQLVSITRDNSGAINTVTTTGVTVAANDVLVLPVTTDTPSGAVDIVQSVTTDGSGNTISAVTPGSPAQAFDSGTVQTSGTVQPSTAAAKTSQITTYVGGRQVPNGPPVHTTAILKCDGQVAATADITVTTTLTPTLTALWSHNFGSLGEVYLGTGGLQTAYVDLTGSVTVGFDASISANGTCSLDLPEIKRNVWAGDLGELVFDSTPSIDLEASGQIAASTSTTLTCSTGYYYTEGGTGTSWHYCQKPVTDPLKLTSSTASATLTGHLPLTVSLDELAGITGELTPSLTATVTPAAQPYATLDARIDASVGACLACFWRDSPAHVTLASATIWGPHRLLSLTTAPGAPAQLGPTITASTYVDQGIQIWYQLPPGIDPADVTDYVCEVSPDDGTTVYPCNSTDGHPSGMGTGNPALAAPYVYLNPMEQPVDPGWQIRMAAVTSAGTQAYGDWFTITNNFKAPTIQSATVTSSNLSVSFTPPPTPGLTVSSYSCEVSPDGGLTVYQCNGGPGAGEMNGTTSPATALNTVWLGPGSSSVPITPTWSVRMWANYGVFTSAKTSWTPIS